MFPFLSLSLCRNPREAGILMQGLSLHKYPSFASPVTFLSMPRAGCRAHWKLRANYISFLSSHFSSGLSAHTCPISPKLPFTLYVMYSFPVMHNTTFIIFILLSDNCIWWKGEEGWALQEIYWKLMTIQNSPLQKVQDNTSLPASWHWEQKQFLNIISAVLFVLCPSIIYQHETLKHVHSS